MVIYCVGKGGRWIFCWQFPMYLLFGIRGESVIIHVGGRDAPWERRLWFSGSADRPWRCGKWLQLMKLNTPGRLRGRLKGQCDRFDLRKHTIPCAGIKRGEKESIVLKESGGFRISMEHSVSSYLPYMNGHAISSATNPQPPQSATRTSRQTSPWSPQK